MRIENNKEWPGKKPSMVFFSSNKRRWFVMRKISGSEWFHCIVSWVQWFSRFEARKRTFIVDFSEFVKLLWTRNHTYRAYSMCVFEQVHERNVSVCNERHVFALHLSRWVLRKMHWKIVNNRLLLQLLDRKVHINAARDFRWTCGKNKGKRRNEAFEFTPLPLSWSCYLWFLVHFIESYFKGSMETTGVSSSWLFGFYSFKTRPVMVLLPTCLSLSRLVQFSISTNIE